MTKVVTRRKLDTGDSGDFLVKTDEEIIMSYAFKKDAKWGIYHEKWDVWAF